MHNELKRRQLFLRLNAILVILWFAFIWGNDLFYDRNSGSEKAVEENLSLTPPALPDWKTFPEVGEPLEEVEASIVASLGEFRRSLRLPEFEQDEALTVFARKLAQNEPTKPPLEPVRVQQLAFVAFPREELGTACDDAFVTSQSPEDAGKDIASLWISRQRINGLDQLAYNALGVGVVRMGQQYRAVLVLAERLFTYSADFPTNVGIDLTASLDERQQDKRVIMRRIHIKRGWLKPITRDIQEQTLVPVGQEVALKQKIPGQFWCRVEFLLDGRPLHHGRPIRGKP